MATHQDEAAEPDMGRRGATRRPAPCSVPAELAYAIGLEVIGSNQGTTARAPGWRRGENSMANLDDTVLAAARQRRAELDLPYYGAVLPDEAHALLEASPEAKLIDVRTRPEWEYVGHVPGSILIEWTTYPGGTRNPRFLDELRAAASAPDTPLLFLCRSGQRSDSAARVAAAAGYTMAFNLLEGFEGAKDQEGHRGTLGGWRKAGLPWVQG